jgi:hypothetical protein
VCRQDDEVVSVARVLDREAEEPAAASTLHRDLENGVAEQSVKAGLQHREHHPILPVSAGGLGTVLYGMQERHCCPASRNTRRCLWSIGRSLPRLLAR